MAMHPISLEKYRNMGLITVWNYLSLSIHSLERKAKQPVWDI